MDSIEQRTGRPPLPDNTPLIRAMRARRLSGVALKDDADRLLIEER